MAKHGPINPLRRLDGNIAELSLLVARAAGMKKEGGVQFELNDFCNWKAAPVEEEATLEGTFMMLQSLAGPKRG